MTNIPTPTTPSQQAALKRNRMALEHVEWLARENRHTTMRDDLAAHAFNCGWATDRPGIMGRGWFRVSLTDLGTRELSNE